MTLPERNIPLPAWQEFSRLQRAAVFLLLLAGLVEIIAGIALPFAGYDTYNHIYWIGEWHTLWTAGIFYPRWLPDSFAGFGAPTFYFYPPFTYILSSALYAVMPGMTPESIGKILTLLALALSGLTMWLYLRWRNPEYRGSQTNVHARPESQTNVRATPALGALLYMFAPYRFFDYSTRGALSEHVSLIFVPLLFLGIDHIIERRTPRNTVRGFVLLLFSIALLIITNLPTAVVAVLGIMIYALAQSGNARKQAVMWSGAGILSAGLLCAFYLLPAYLFSGDAQIGRLWTPVPMAWSSPLTAIFTGENITIDVYSLLMFLGAAILFAACFRIRTRNRGIFAILLAVLVLQLPIVSYYLFSFVPPFTVAQLPYRFAVLVLIAAALIWQKELRNKKGAIVSLLVAAWSLAVVGLIAFQFAKVHIHPNDRLPIGDAPEYSTHWERPPTFQKHGQQAYLDFAATLATPFANNVQSVLLPGGIQPNMAKRENYSDTVDFTSNDSGQAILRRSYWPTWKASIDGIPTTTAPDSLGRLTVPVPKGQHRLIVWLETPTAAKIGMWISIGSLVVLGMIGILV
ncbi:MAG TPA: hypothetical protein VFH95_04060 [Candidatus Kapabacteria bacterium]|nr:hypothetical protein [Candidatus Kapabacteria bacterium]